MIKQSAAKNQKLFFVQICKESSSDWQWNWGSTLLPLTGETWTLCFLLPCFKLRSSHELKVLKQSEDRFVKVIGMLQLLRLKENRKK